jgi:hypothetical protein
MNVFKVCPHCGKRWSGRSQFLEDPELELAGYQADFRDPKLGLLLFNHHVCRTTLAIRADSVRDLYTGPVYSARQTGSEACLGHCLRQEDVGPCAVSCECAWVREVLQVIRNWPKNGTAGGQMEAAAS